MLYVTLKIPLKFGALCGQNFSTKRTAVIRASDDFWPRDPASHTIHIASVAYNTIFLGEFMQPDWDMFHVS